MPPKFVMGVDLHGTLLDARWKIKSQFQKMLVHRFRAMAGRCDAYLCSGNDLTFVRHIVPNRLLGCFRGFVLETGCVVSQGQEETVQVSRMQVRQIKKLETELQKLAWKEVKYFARRLCTISLFTRDPRGGTDPARLLPRVQKAVRRLDCSKAVIVTHSDVAVDIVPNGYDKYRGLLNFAGRRPTIGIADSWNDAELLLGAGFAFVPRNVSPKLLGALRRAGRQIQRLGSGSNLTPGMVFQSRFSNTRAVIQVLDFLLEQWGRPAQST